MLEFLVDNIFVVFFRKSLPADSRHSNEYELCPSSRRHLSVFIRSGFHSVFALNGKETSSRFNLTYRYIDDVLSINNPEFENYLGQMYPAELEIKDTTESTTSASYLDLLLSIGRDGQLHTTTSEMISISRSQSFRSWVVIFHHRRPLACLSLSLYDTLGLAPSMNVLFWGPSDFPVSYSNRDTLWNAWNRHSGSFMVDTVILLINMK